MTNRDVEERLRPHIAHVVNLGLDDPDAILTAREQALRDLADAALTLLRRERPHKDAVSQVIDRDALRLQVWKAVTRSGGEVRDEWLDYATDCILALMQPAEEAAS